MPNAKSVQPYVGSQRFFSYEKGGKVKKLKYGKLKHAPQLIENLNLKKLCEDFEDVRCLVEKITTFAWE